MICVMCNCVYIVYVCSVKCVGLRTTQLHYTHHTKEKIACEYEV